MTKIYPSNFERKIGFDQIRELLKGRCLSSLGKENVEKCEFSQTFSFIEKQIEETLEFQEIIEGEDNFPISTFSDARPSLKKAKIEGTFLEVQELFELKRSLETIRSIVHFFSNKEEDQFLRLRSVIKDVKIFPFVYDRIDQIVTKHGKIKDNASPELNHIRREILSRQSSVSKTMQAILRRAQADGYVDKDTAVSIRDGRAVIPIPASNKRRVKGIVHDESATGKTAYIEPAEIVETNNAIRELEYAERREIVKILTDFTNAIRPYIDDILYSYIILGQLDFIRAKAIFSRETESLKPNLMAEPHIEWEKARHPLLEINLRKEGRAIVPLNIELNKRGRILLISGPNAGGKSVCLKTTGLLQYMLQCGMPIPVKEESRAGVFDHIFIDIGDEQSIENDLSTYSSHLMNMKFFAKNCQENTLILIDEFGTGTEPMLGGAIAEAVLNDLNKKKTFGVITTHYTNLKHFASSVEGIENGAMLYDSHRMEPLFQLEVGKPGSSFAFEIARKIGLPEEILAEATEKLGKDHINFDKHLREISRDKRYWETKRQKIRKVEKRLDELADDYKSNLQESNQMRKEIIEKAKVEAERILADSNKHIERTIREIKESQADKEKTKSARKKLETFKENVSADLKPEDEKIRRKMDKLREKEERRKKGGPKNEDKESDKSKNAGSLKIKKPVELKLEVGAKVRLKDRENVGEVIEIAGNNVTIAFGMLRSVAKKNKIVVVSNSQAKKINSGNKNSTMGKVNQQISDQKLSFRPEIDVRGERADEAMGIIQNFIDEAIMVEARELRILHGKGNGILRELIRKLLKTEPMVKSFRDEHVQLGGAGITIVQLD